MSSVFIFLGGQTLAEAETATPLAGPASRGSRIFARDRVNTSLLGKCSWATIPWWGRLSSSTRGHVDVKGCCMKICSSMLGPFMRIPLPITGAISSYSRRVARSGFPPHVRTVQTPISSKLDVVRGCGGYIEGYRMPMSDPSAYGAPPVPAFWGRELRHEDCFRARRLLGLFSKSDTYLQRVRLAVQVARTRGAFRSESERVEGHSLKGASVRGPPHGVQMTTGQHRGLPHA